MHILEMPDPPDWINVGSGTDIPIIDLAKSVKSIVGYDGEIVFDTNKPDGTPRKLLDVSQLFNTGWRPKIELEEGLRRTYRDFLKEQEKEVLRGE